MVNDFLLLITLLIKIHKRIFLSISICVFLQHLQVPRHMTADVGKELLRYLKDQSGVKFR